ncbi:MAG: hypothetical protein J6D00_08320 [Christensenellaceae bacterium]|nr:hypothetical protein [Christensenellaceae bacterium]
MSSLHEIKDEMPIELNTEEKALLASVRMREPDLLPGIMRKIGKPWVKKMLPIVAAAAALMVVCLPFLGRNEKIADEAKAEYAVYAEEYASGTSTEEDDVVLFDRAMDAAGSSAADTAVPCEGGMEESMEMGFFEKIFAAIADFFDDLFA